MRLIGLAAGHELHAAHDAVLVDHRQHHACPAPHVGGNGVPVRTKILALERQHVVDRGPAFDGIGQQLDQLASPVLQLGRRELHDLRSDYSHSIVAGGFDDMS